MITTVQQQPPKATYGPVSGPICGVLLALLTSLMIRNAGLPIWVPLAVAVAAAAATWGADRVRRRRPLVTVYAAGCWLAGATWATLTGWLGYSWGGVVALAIIALVAGILAQALAPAPDVTPTVPMPRPSEDPKAATIRRLLDSAFKLREGAGCRVSKLVQWKGNTGYTATVTFPGGSRVTLRRVQDEAEVLQSELRLPNGGTVRVSPGSHHAEVVIDVTTLNKLADDVPFPMPCRKRSIRDPFPIGIYADGSTAEINLSQASALFVARRGGGKTVLMHDLVAQLAQCADAVIWVIDCNGAGAAMPWMHPYAVDEVDRPVFDWVASTPEEAINMAATALAIALDRKSRYAPLLVKANTDVLPVSPSIPAIAILVDEGHEITGTDASKPAQRAAAHLERLQKIGRAMGVQVHFTAQRGVMSYLPSNIKAGSQIRMVGPVEQDSEIAFVLDWQKGLSARDLTGHGQWFLRSSLSVPPRIAKTYGLLPDQIRSIATATEAWRPQMDQPGQDVGADIYAQRFARMAPWLRRVAGHPDEEIELAAPDLTELIKGRDPAASGVAAAQSIADTIKARTAALFAEARGGAAEPAPLPVPAPQAADDDVPDWVAPSAVQPTAVAELTEGQQFILARIVEASPPGLRTQELVEAAMAAGLTQRRTTVSEWITALREAGLVSPTSWGTHVATEAQEATE